MPDSAPKPTRLTIKKYPNRRFYDVTRSRHITLEQIFKAVRAGYEVRVIDSKRQRDITARVLAQIILEMDTFKLDSFPTALLHQLIRSNDTMVQEFMEAHFTDTFEWFSRTRQLMEGHMRRALGLGGETGDTFRDSADTPEATQAPADGEPAPEPRMPAPPPPLSDLDARLKRLDERLHQVQGRLTA